MSNENNNLVLPETGFLRINDVLRFIPVCKATWWAGIRDGRYPKAVKLSARTSAWKVEDIRALIKELSAQN